MAAQNLARAVYRHEEAYASTDAFLEAYSRGDAAACAALYTKDATVLPGDRPVASGREEIEALFAGIFEQRAKKLTLVTERRIYWAKGKTYDTDTLHARCTAADGGLAASTGKHQ